MRWGAASRTPRGPTHAAGGFRAPQLGAGGPAVEGRASGAGPSSVPRLSVSHVYAKPLPGANNCCWRFPSFKGAPMLGSHARRRGVQSSHTCIVGGATTVPAQCFPDPPEPKIKTAGLHKLPPWVLACLASGDRRSRKERMSPSLPRSSCGWASVGRSVGWLIESNAGRLAGLAGRAQEACWVSPFSSYLSWPGSPRTTPLFTATLHKRTRA